MAILVTTLLNLRSDRYDNQERSKVVSSRTLVVKGTAIAVRKGNIRSGMHEAILRSVAVIAAATLASMALAVGSPSRITLERGLLGSVVFASIVVHLL